MEGTTANPEDDEKPLLLTPDSFVTHSHGPTQSATVVNDSAATFLTSSVALNTLPPILPQKHSTFENESTAEICNSTDETSVGVSEDLAGLSLASREQYESEAFKITGMQCDGGTVVKEEPMGKEEDLYSDSEVAREKSNKIYDKTKNNLTGNPGCSSNVLEEDDEFPILNA